MLTLPANYQDAAALRQIEPRYVLALSFHDDSISGANPNLLTKSEDFSHADWLKSGGATVTTNTDTAPDGALTADTLNDPGANYSQIYRTLTIDPANIYTFSVFVKKDTTARSTRFAAFYIRYSGSTSENTYLQLDTSTGESDSFSPSLNFEASVESWDASWWRVRLSARSLDQSNTTITVTIYPAVGASATWVNSAAATGSIVAWGAQLSESPSALEYVATDTAAATAGSPDTNVYWLTSHSDALVLPGVGSVDRLDKCINRRGITGATQKIDYSTGRFSIGTLTVQIADIGGALSDRINAELSNGEGVRRKQIKFYKGQKSLTNWTDYPLYITYRVDSITYLDGIYTLTCSDIQRSAKTDIFEPHQGVLTKSITASSTAIPVTTADAVNKFPLVAHDAVYGANPSDSVGYIKIDDEIICHDGWITANTELNVIERGALGTKAVRHVVTEVEVINRKRVTEYFYLEMPAPKMILALLGGNLYGQSATLPDHWHAGIPTRYIDESDFTGIGADLWNTSTNQGRIARFLGMEAIDAKRFIETELCRWLDCFMPVKADGTIGLKRYGGILPDSAFDELVQEFDIIKHDALKHDLKALTNNIAVSWNWIDRLERFTKFNGLVDADSITKHGQADLKHYEFKGVFTGNHSDADIFNFFTSIRDRFSNPPLRLSLSLTPAHDPIEVGDTVRVVDQHIRDYNTSGGFDRSMQVMQSRIDWVTGMVTLDLFGGIAKSTEATIADSNVLIDNFYTSAGTELSTVLTISAGAVTANGTLNGGADAASNVFYYDGNLTINNGVTVTINRNIQLRIKGTLTVNGKIDLDGNTADGEVGVAATGYGSFAKLVYYNPGQGYDTAELFRYRQSNNARGIYPNGLPVFNILNRDGTALEGVPGDVAGVSGPVGQDAQMIGNDPDYTAVSLTATGGAGGIGGGGLVIVCRGMAMGLSSEIDTSGTDGSAGGSISHNGIALSAQTGAGGFPGGVLVLIDGNYSAPDFNQNNVTANRGAQTVPASVDVFVGQVSRLKANDSDKNWGYGQNVTVSGTINYWESITRVQYIPEAQEQFFWLPENERRLSAPQRNLSELLLNNLVLDEPGVGAYCVTAREGLFVAAGVAGATDTYIATSPDLVEWTERANPGTALIDDAWGINYANGYFLIACGDGVSPTGAGAILYSTDGVTWSRVAITRHVESVNYGNGVYVAVGYDDGTDAGIYTATTPGGTWTERSNPKAFDLNDVVYSPELDLWAAVGDADGTDAYIVTAPDPTSTWTERSNPTNGTLTGIAWGNGLFVAVGSNASASYIVYSTDGVTWSEVASYPVTDEYLSQVRYIDGLFVAVGSYDDTVVGATIWISENGSTWWRIANPAPREIRDVAFDGSAFLFTTFGTPGESIKSVRVETT